MTESHKNRIKAQLVRHKEFELAEGKIIFQYGSALAESLNQVVIKR